MRFVNLTNPNVQVVLLHEGQLRIGESVWEAVVYQRGDKVYIRKKAEFLAKFRLLN